MAVRVSSPPRPRHPASDSQGYSAIVAASQLSDASFINYETRIRRAAMASAETPVVRLPGRTTCLSCPHHARRYSVILVKPDPDAFADLVEKNGEGFDVGLAADVGPPRILAGVDFAEGPHFRVTPGFDDLSRIKEPTVLTEALFFNRILPECPCTKELFEAADDEGWPGTQLDFLRQEAALKARTRPPATVT